MGLGPPSSWLKGEGSLLLSQADVTHLAPGGTAQLRARQQLSEQGMRLLPRKLAQDSVLMVLRVQNLILEVQKLIQKPFRDFPSSSPCISLPPSEEQCLKRGSGRGCLFI